MSSAQSLSRAATAAGLFVIGTLTPACSASKPTAPPPQATQLWGDMKPIVSVKELMRDMLDPLADNIFQSVATITDKNGTTEKVPKTDEDWETIRIGAVTMAEGAYLLKVRRPFAPPGDENNSTGPDAVELSPAQIMAKVEKDPVEWNARIEALRNVGLEVLDIVKRKDVKELWDAAENLDRACESCHKSYWYPGETPEFYRKLERRLADYGSRSSQAVTPAKPSK
jgi:cytochrome c556